jgi:transposase
MLRAENDGGMQVKGLREVVLIHDLKRQGLSITAIAREVGCDRKTVRKYLDLGWRPRSMCHGDHGRG